MSMGSSQNAAPGTRSVAAQNRDLVRLIADRQNIGGRWSEERLKIVSDVAYDLA